MQGTLAHCVSFCNASRIDYERHIELVRTLKKDDKGEPIVWHFCYAYYHSSTWDACCTN